MVNDKVLSTANVPVGNVVPTEVNITFGDYVGQWQMVQEKGLSNRGNLYPWKKCRISGMAATGRWSRLGEQRFLR